MKQKHFNVFLVSLLFIGDILLVYVSFITAYHARFHWPWVVRIFPVTKGVPFFTGYQQLLYLGLFLYGAVFLFNKFYRNRILSAMDELLLIIEGVFIGTLLVIAVTFIYRGYEYSRLVFGLGAGLAVILIFFWHMISRNGYQWFIRLVAGPQNVLVIGELEQIETIKKTVSKHKFIRPYYVLEKKDEKVLIDMIIKRKIDEVYSTPTYFESGRLLSFSDKCEQLGVDFKVIPSMLQLCQGQIVIDNSLGIPIFHIKPVSLYGINSFYKRIFDLVASILVLSMLFIPLSVVALMIVADSPGPVFYRHKRMGFQNRVFDFLKFRTMIVDADKKLEQLRHLTERAGPVFKMEKDPRITRIGKFLRRYSIDELPQLINVIKGDMSLVGPRPQVLWEAAAYDDFARRRLRVLPGMTGLWQVSGRARLSYKEMIELDIYYIENWTLGLDLRILFKTIMVIFSKIGAY